MSSPRAKAVRPPISRRILILGAILGACAGALAVTLYNWINAFFATPVLRQHHPAVSNPYSFVSAPLVSEDEYFNKVIDTSAPPKHRASCRELLMRKRGFTKADEDLFIFHTFFKRLTEPGVYLDISDSDADGKNSFFFDVCLGWKGVVVRKKAQARGELDEARSARFIEGCISPKQESTATRGGDGNNCVSLEKLLSEHEDILGQPDAQGRFGTKINYVSLDLSGAEGSFLACANLAGLFSFKSNFQVWSVATSLLTGGQLRYVDAALLLAGYVKATPVLHQGRGFMDDIYVMMPAFAGDNTLPLRLTQHRCLDGRSTCALSDIIYKQPLRGNGEVFPNCRYS